MKVSTIYSALIAASILFTGVALAENNVEVKKQVKVIKLHEGSTHISSADGENVITFDFEGELDEAKINEILADVPVEKQEKLREILSTLKIESSTDENGKFKVFSLGDSNASFVKVLNADMDHQVELMSDGGKEVRAFSFSFDGKKGMDVELIKQLISQATLTPEQIVELQDLLATK